MPRREIPGQYPYVVLERTTGIEHDRYTNWRDARMHVSQSADDLITYYEGPIARRVMPLIRRAMGKIR